MTRQITAAEQLQRLGAEVKNTQSGAQITNAQSNFTAKDLGSELTEITEFGSIAGFPGLKMDIATAFFERKGVPKSLARAYGASLLQASQNSGRDITELLNIGETIPNVFSDTALTHINIFRGKTSQIGYKVPAVTKDIAFVQRTVLP